MQKQQAVSSELFLPKFAAKTTAVRSVKMAVRQTLSPPPPTGWRDPANRLGAVLAGRAERLLNFVDDRRTYENFMWGHAVSTRAVVQDSLPTRGKITQNSPTGQSATPELGACRSGDEMS